MRSILAAAFFLGLLPVGSANEPELQAPPGFAVTLYAGPEIASDLYAMTLDAKGRVVVTSQGWIKTLHEGQSPGRAERATVFATTKTGGMGLCFDGSDLLFCGDGWLSRYRDADGDGQVDGPPEQLVPLRFNDHGGHAVRKGPDGWWYVVGGNDSPLDARLVTGPRSPVRSPEAGGVLRLSPDGRRCEVLAHGFRNPYDFDFNAAGDLFTFDSDTERDFLLPWYSPTRLYHVAHAGHHGWRLPGYMRSWARPDFHPDTVGVLAPIGRGSPTGVVCYRHRQFPPRYRDGLFFLDWTFGRVWFTPLDADGSTYRASPEIFLEARGTAGFAPTDLAVAPDGALLLSIGGRRTRGSVYCIAYLGDGRERSTPPSDLDAVLDAPQPLDAWSRAIWMPQAKKLGPAPFAAALADERRPAAARIRAVEVLTEVFGGLPTDAAKAGSRSTSPLVRARIAWSLGRALERDAAGILTTLAKDSDSRVRLHALDAIGDRLSELDAEAVLTALTANLDHSEPRVRQAATRVAALLPDAAWQRSRTGAEQRSTQARLSLQLADLWRTPRKELDAAAVDRAVKLFAESSDTNLRRQAVRQIVLALGDYNLHAPSAEVFTGYSPAFPVADRALAQRVLQTTRPAFPASEERLDDELARLFAMLEDDNAETVRRVATLLTDTSSPTRDMHFLAVLARLHGPRDANTRRTIAAAVLSLHKKFAGREQRIKQNWTERFTEIVQALLRRDPALADELLRHAEFVAPSHVDLALALPNSAKLGAARRFLQAARSSDEFTWSSPLIQLLGTLPDAEVRPVMLERWHDLDLRDALLVYLARQPQAANRDKFLIGLAAFSPAARQDSLAALEQLPPDPTAEHLVPLLRLLNRMIREPSEAKLRTRLVALIERQTGVKFDIRENKPAPEKLAPLYQPVFDWFERQHPDLAKKLAAEGGPEDPAAWRTLLGSVAWDHGDARRGEQLFRARNCLACHAGTSRLAPDLTGVATRFSRDDLFTAIAAPGVDVPPAYQLTQIETTSGKVYQGIVAFQAAESVILLTGHDTSIRIATEEIETRRPVAGSIMPNGLLKDLGPRDLADLYRYLQTLKP